MPFRSKKQQRYMYSQMPDIAADYAKEMSKMDFAKLPEKAKKKKKSSQKSKKKTNKKKK